MKENKKLRNIVRKIQVVSFAISLIVALLFIFLLSDLPYETWAEYADGRILYHSDKDILQDIPAMILFLQFLVSVGLVVLNIIDRIRNKAKICGSVLLSLAIFVFSFFAMGLSTLCLGDSDRSEYNPVCYTFTDNNHTIVIEEYSYLLMGGATVWQVNDDNTVNQLGSFSTDDGGRNNGKYEIDWSAESVAITYNYFNLDNDRITKKFDFS